MIINAFFIGLSFGLVFGLMSSWKPRLTIGILAFMLLLSTAASEATGVSVLALNIPVVELIAELVGLVIGMVGGCSIGET